VRAIWDTKRQIIWLAAGLALGTLVIYQEALDETGAFDRTYFIQLEILLLTIISVMFYVYSKNKG